MRRVEQHAARHHRSLRPSNLLESLAGDVQVTDFLPILGLLACCSLFTDLAGWHDFKPVRALWGQNASLAMFEYTVSKWGWGLGSACVLLANPSGPYVGASMCFGAFGIASALSVSGWAWWRHRKNPEPPQLSRGALFDGVSAVRRKAGIATALNIYLLPDEFRAGFRHPDQPTVFLPRQLVDRLSRAEIDALVAYQLRRPRAHSFWAYAFLSVLVCGAGFSVALNALKIGTAGRWGAFLALAIVEIAALSFTWRSRRDSHQRWAMKLTGDPEAYVSALAALSRLSTGVPDAHLIRRLARIANLSPDRIPELLQERSCPADQRYPTVGDYMTVGF